MRNRGRNKRIKPVGVGVEVGVEVGVGLKVNLEVEAPLTVILILRVI
jgi:hypothetical protein